MRCSRCPAVQDSSANGEPEYDICIAKRLRWFEDFVPWKTGWCDDAQPYHAAKWKWRAEISGPRHQSRSSLADDIRSRSAQRATSNQYSHTPHCEKYLTHAQRYVIEGERHRYLHAHRVSAACPTHALRECHSSPRAVKVYFCKLPFS